MGHLGVGCRSPQWWVKAPLPCAGLPLGVALSVLSGYFTNSMEVGAAVPGTEGKLSQRKGG
jgi:hypothetical protein